MVGRHAPAIELSRGLVPHINLNQEIPMIQQLFNRRSTFIGLTAVAAIAFGALGTPTPANARPTSGAPTAPASRCRRCPPAA